MDDRARLVVPVAAEDLPVIIDAGRTTPRRAGLPPRRWSTAASASTSTGRTRDRAGQSCPSPRPSRYRRARPPAPPASFCVIASSGEFMMSSRRCSVALSAVWVSSSPATPNTGARIRLPGSRTVSRGRIIRMVRRRRPREHGGRPHTCGEEPRHTTLHRTALVRVRHRLGAAVDRTELIDIAGQPGSPVLPHPRESGGELLREERPIDGQHAGAPSDVGGRA